MLQYFSLLKAGTIYFAMFLLAIEFFAAAPAMAEKTTSVIISDGSGLGQLCVAARDCFSPRVLHIETGTTVDWKNNDHLSHTVTSGSPYSSSVGNVFDSGLLAPGKDFAYTFHTAGTYQYFCEVNPWIRGEIDVAGQEQT